MSDTKPYRSVLAQIEVDTQRVIHTMAGGVGASWHAAGPTAFHYKNLCNRANRNARGSAWGGNPPLEFTEAWDDLFRHARWLGLNFIRVELDLRMYEPERGRFDWTNDEMQTLYRILDYCEREGVDVFLTQMAQDVEWNAFDGISRLQSAPRSTADFVDGVATLMEYLVKGRDYTCIRWLCINNEPGFEACWWLGPDGRPADVMPAIRAVRAELDRRGISVPLSGPDWCDLGQNTPDFDLGDKALGALDAHNYKATVSADLMKLWAERAHARGIPFFQSEFGTWNGDDPFKNPTAISPRSYSNQMLNAEKLIAGLNAGVDGFNRWSFVNRGDLDGQWQLVRTWDAQRWDYYRRVEPEPVPYFSYGILTRFLAKYSRILSTEVSGDSIVASAIQSPAGDLTIYVLNNADMEKMINLNIAGRTEFPELNKYQVTQSGIEGADYKMDPLRLFGLKDSPPNLAADTVPPGSITVYSTLNKECL